MWQTLPMQAFHWSTQFPAQVGSPAQVAMQACSWFEQATVQAEASTRVARAAETRTKAAARPNFFRTGTLLFVNARAAAVDDVTVAEHAAIVERSAVGDSAAENRAVGAAHGIRARGCRCGVSRGGAGGDQGGGEQQDSGQRADHRLLLGKWVSTGRSGRYGQVNVLQRSNIRQRRALNRFLDLPCHVLDLPSRFLGD